MGPDQGVSTAIRAVGGRGRACGARGVGRPLPPGPGRGEGRPHVDVPLAASGRPLSRPIRRRRGHRPMLALLCVAIVTASLLGGALPLASVLTHTRLQLYLSFAAGAMLGAAFFHMLPEAVRLGSAGTLRWTAVGLLALFFLERFFAFHHHEAPADPEEPCPTHPHEHA